MAGLFYAWAFQVENLSPRRHRGHREKFSQCNGCRENTLHLPYAAFSFCLLDMYVLKRLIYSTKKIVLTSNCCGLICY
jgi:hypothetical protein